MNDLLLNNIKLLRDKTGVGFMECKQALIKSNNNLDLAIDDLRKLGVIKAVDKSSRLAADGVIYSCVNEFNTLGVILEVNCETDFVSRDFIFLDYVDRLAKYVLNNRVFDLNVLNDTVVGRERIDLVNKYGENINIRRIKYLENMNGGFINCYVHNNKVGSLLEIDKREELVSKDLAMHAVACNPKYLDIYDVPIEVLNKEKDIYVFDARNRCLGKNEDLVTKIVEGKVKDYYKQVVFYEQYFIKEVKVKIRDYLLNRTKILNFFRFSLGEII